MLVCGYGEEMKCLKRDIMISCGGENGLKLEASWWGRMNDIKFVLIFLDS